MYEMVIHTAFIYFVRVENDSGISNTTKRLIEKSHSLSKMMCGFSILFPVLSVIGRTLDISILSKGHPTLPAMVPNTAMGLVLGALAFSISQKQARPSWQTAISGLISVVILLLGVLTLCEYAFGWVLELDKIFVNEIATVNEPFPGRPSPQTSFNFVLLGIALLSLNFQSIPIYLLQASSIFMAANALIAATGYIFSTSQFYGFPIYTPAIGMAIHTSAGFILQSGALLFSRPSEGLMSLVVSDTRSGAMTRKVVFSAVATPPLVGIVTKLGVLAGWYDMSVQVSLFAVVIVVLIIRAIWRAAKQADIEERRSRAVEDQLRQSEAMASGIVSISADAIISVDNDQRITVFNEGAENIFGYAKSEVMGELLDMLIPERFRAVHRSHVEKFANGPQVSRVPSGREHAIIGLRKNGDEFPVDATISKLEVGGKRILTASLRDISMQKKIEHEQRFLAEIGLILASTLNYEDTLDNIIHIAVREFADLCIIYVIDENGEIRRSKAISRDTSKAWVCDILMKIPFDKTRKNPIDLVAESRQPMLIEQVSSEMIEVMAHNSEHLRALRGAEVRSFIIAPLLVHGRLIGAINLVASSTSRGYEQRDIPLAEELARRAAVAIENSQLHRDAQRAKLIADNIPAMMAYWDKDQRCQFANRAYFDWFGLEPKMVIGRTMLDVLGPTLYEKNLIYIQAALEGKRQNFERELTLQSTGELRHTSAIYLPEKINGKVLGFFVLVFDVTELKEAQLTAISEKEKAMAAVKTRERVLAIVSHDLKSPLTTISLVAQFLQKMEHADLIKIHDYANRVQRAGDQMQTLIGDLLDFGKIQAGTFSVEKFRENLTEIILSALEGLRTLAEAKRQNLVVEISGTLSEVSCDAARIVQVLSNLLGNAIKFTPEGGTIKLKVTQSATEVIVSVHDTGPGIPAENLSKVFDQFWQAQETKQLGSGLGLSIAKGIIEAHGSRIWAESQVGKGSCFSFTVPLATTETASLGQKMVNRELLH